MKIQELRQIIKEEINSLSKNNSEVRPLGFILTYKGLPCNTRIIKPNLYIHTGDINTKSDISYYTNSKRYWEAELKEIEQRNFSPEEVSIDYRRTPLNEEYDFNNFNIKEIKIIY